MNRTRALEQLAESAADELEQGAITPDRDLWPELAATLTRRRRERRARRVRRVGAAAGVLAGVLVAGSHLLSRSDRHSPAHTTQPPQVALASAADSALPTPTGVPEILGLRAELATVLAAEDLPASARTAIVDALAAIERERLALDQALAATPESAQLARLRFEHDAREAELLHRLHRLTRSV